MTLATTYQHAQGLQEALCSKRGVEYIPAPAESHVGIALHTLGQLPVNGLRHPPHGKTNGWYLWCGITLSSDPDFFVPLCASHLIEKCPEAVSYLGLPPGYRFLLGDGHVDIWFDQELLNV